MATLLHIEIGLLPIKTYYCNYLKGMTDWQPSIHKATNMRSKNMGEKLSRGDIGFWFAYGQRIDPVMSSSM